MQEPQALCSVFTLQRREAPPYLMCHGPLQALVRRHPTNGTVRVRPNRRNRTRPGLQVKRAQPTEAAPGPNSPLPSRQRVRRAPRCQTKPQATARVHRLSQTKTPAGQPSQRMFAYPRAKRRCFLLFAALSFPKCPSNYIWMTEAGRCVATLWSANPLWCCKCVKCLGRLSPNAPGFDLSQVPPPSPVRNAYSDGATLFM
jgi:hypothetical protein